MQIRQQAFELWRLRFRQRGFETRHTTGERLCLRHSRGIAPEHRLHVPMAGDQPGNLQPHLLYKLGAEINVVSEIINACCEAFQRQTGAVPG